jgi:hypothetical protein
MIPNIFVSSTVDDLRYLRDGLREAIEDLAYNAILSEHGGVGYLRPTTAAESCVATVQQCQMMVLIVGKRYGSITEDGRSVTHHEMRKARELRIPIITFVETDVLAYKKIYDANRSIPLKDFPGMDNPAMTFQLIDEVVDAPFYNGLIQFGTVGDAQKHLKAQIANFVGDALGEVISPIKAEIQDLRSDVKSLIQTIRPVQDQGATNFVKVMRFLLDDTNAYYRKLLEHVFGNIDVAVAKVMDARTFDDVIKTSGARLEVVDDQAQLKALIDGSRTSSSEDPPAVDRMCVNAQWGSVWGGYGIFADGRVVLDAKAKRHFDARQQQLRIQLGDFSAGTVPD